ncbi:hypothetical protein FACS1894184_18600 [Clostridia bacterium]|nr:hypothetical protein FACS1894184_18600 [Clostridia bacterium]
MENNRLFYTVKALAKEYGISAFALRGLARSGAFPVIKRGKRIYIVKSAFDAFLQKEESFTTNSIPQELRDRLQWVTWLGDKIPRQINGSHASTTNSAT